MKILTLNLHCFAEEQIQRNQEIIATFIKENDVDIVFFQEVAQHQNSKKYSGTIKQDNYVLQISNLLHQQGFTNDFYFDVSNLSFGQYDEGLAILSKHRLFLKESFYVSRETSYEDWHTRKIVKATIKYQGEYVDLYSVHFGWTEGVEVFEDQFELFSTHINHDNINIIAGDFNQSQDSDEYNFVCSKGWMDLYATMDMKEFNDPTHIPYIDVKKEAKRIDYIFSDSDWNVIKRKRVFTNPLVSDHFGVYIEMELEE